MPTPNSFGFDASHREVVQTTGRTSSPTLQALCVNRYKRVRLGIDLVMKIAEGRQSLVG